MGDLDDMCWCGEKIAHEEWCREHAPRCRSGAHFKNNCGCVGDAMLTGVRASEATAEAIARYLEGEARIQGKHFQGQAAGAALMRAAEGIRDGHWRG